MYARAEVSGAEQGLAVLEVCPVARPITLSCPACSLLQCMACTACARACMLVMHESSHWPNPTRTCTGRQRCLAAERAPEGPAPRHRHLRVLGLAPGQQRAAPHAVPAARCCWPGPGSRLQLPHGAAPRRCQRRLEMHLSVQRDGARLWPDVVEGGRDAVQRVEQRDQGLQR